MSFAKRLSALMIQKGLSMSDLAKTVGVSRQTVSFWRSGRNEPTAEKLKLVAKALETSPLWLKTGTDSIQTTNVVVAEDADNSEYFFIPEYELTFGCSNGGPLAPEWVESSEEQAAYRLEFFQRRHIDPSKCRRVKAVGDSMEPLICDGDKVLFVEQAKGTNIVDGKVYALSFGGMLKIKRLYRKLNGDLVIRSENPKYEDEIVPNAEIDDCVLVFGQVIERSGSI